MSHRQTLTSSTRRANRTLARRPLVTGAALTAAVVLLGGCGLPTQATRGGNSASSTGAASARPATVAVRALDGRRVQVPSQRPTVLYFFSAGCGECVNGARAVAQARKQAGAAATFLAVDLDPTETPAIIGEFAAAAGDPDLPTASDRDAALSRRYQVTALSTLVVIDPAGTVTYRAVDSPAAQILTAIAKAGGS
jgi:AhpC/TSA family